VTSVLKWVSCVACLLLVAALAQANVPNASPVPPADERYPCIVTAPLGDGTLCLVAALSHEFYWMSGAGGKNADKMARNEFRGRKFMSDHDGDWCLFFVSCGDPLGVDCDHVLRVGPSSRDVVQLRLADSSMIEGDLVVAIDSPAEKIFWTNQGSTTIWFYSGCPVGRMFDGRWPIFVRFPAGSCPLDRGDGELRHFTSVPLGMEVLHKGGE